MKEMFKQGVNFIGFFHENEEYGFLSNWYKCKFKSGRFTYTSMEQYMMHMKVLLFREYDLADKIMETDDPAECKQLGRTRFTSFDADKWDKMCGHIVKKGLRAKFMQNKELLEALLETDDCILAECSPYDKKWGIGIDICDERRLDAEQWEGKNLLGRLLMEIREELRDRKTFTYMEAMDLEPIDEWMMRPGELMQHPAYHGAVRAYAMGLRDYHEMQAFYYDASFLGWEEAMRHNMGGGLTWYGFWEMKQEIYDIASRIKR